LNDTLSVVIPTYKESENIRILIPKIEQEMHNINKEGEIIIVDDNSEDGIVDIVETQNALYHNINLIIRKGTRGIASAWLEGIRACRGEEIVIMDADLCHNPIYFQPMLEVLNIYDMVIGSRYMSEHKVRMENKSFIAVFLSQLGQVLSRWVLRLNQSDMSHSFRMFRREVFIRVGDDLCFNGNVMMIEFTYRATCAGFRITEVPIIYEKRKFGKTKLNVLSQGLLFIKALFYLRFLDRKEI